MTTTEPWTTRRLLKWMTDAFAKAEIDSPRMSAELLLSHVIGCERLRLYMEVDRPASPLERDTLRDLARRALAHEPVQYLTGEAWFFGMPFHSDARALIPRPSTETIIEAVIHHCRTTPDFGGSDRATAGEGTLIADVCTGSGIIACALAKELPGTRIVATDVSQDALTLAAENAQKHALADRIEFIKGDLLQPLLDHPTAGQQHELHVLASNPPYIPDFEWEDVPANVRDYEPVMALRGGVDGLDFVRTLIVEGPKLLRPNGLLAIELASSHSDQALELAKSNTLLKECRLVKDHEGLPRTLLAERG